MGVYRELVRAALQRLGVKRLVLAIHDASFPSAAHEDIGRGLPGSEGGRRWLTFAAALGFDAIQLGPQGEISPGYPSPYDATFLSRSALSIPLAELEAAGLVSPDLRKGLIPPISPSGNRAHHRHAWKVQRTFLTEAFARYRAALAAGDERARARDASLVAFRAEQRAWLDENATEMDVWTQLLAHEAHASVRRFAAAQGLAFFGDLAVGMAPHDRARWQRHFVPGYHLGAPPSRTNPMGQPWGYPIFDPQRDAARLVRLRADKLFAEFDALRIDHPHGLVCPWVYRADEADPLVAVQRGARLHESPDLPEHPELTRHAIARSEQLDRSRPRHADDWVRELDPQQVDGYAALFDELVRAAAAHGKPPGQALICEVLSTLPRPLAEILARHGLGRFRITQKANLADPADVYRSENAAPGDWVMVGTHDTAPLFSVVRGWSDDERRAQAAYLAGRLSCPAFETRLASDPDFLAQAKLADLFVSRGGHVMVFFADVLGLTERYNVPGTVSDDNWTLRVPRDYERTFGQAANARRAMDLRCVLALALRSRRDEDDAALALRLEELPAAPD